MLGRSALRAVALSDLTNDEALAYSQTRLKAVGVNNALVRAGVKHGHIVRIGSFTFEYQEDL